MTVLQLVEILNNYPDDAHVVVAVYAPGMQERREIHDAWCDRWGVVNVIATTRCDGLDPDLASENNLGRP